MRINTNIAITPPIIKCLLHKVIRPPFNLLKYKYIDLSFIITGPDPINLEHYWTERYRDHPGTVSPLLFTAISEAKLNIPLPVSYDSHSVRKEPYSPIFQTL